MTLHDSPSPHTDQLLDTASQSQVFCDAVCETAGDGSHELPRQLSYSLGTGTFLPLDAATGEAGRLSSPTFITDPPELRKARKDAANAKLCWIDARDSREPHAHLHRSGAAWP